MKLNAVLTILGSGTSTGVPLPGCPCPVCQSHSTRNQRLRCSAWLKTQDNRSILIDAGPDLRQQALRSQIEKIDAVLFTHAHADHILGIDDLRAFNFIQQGPIECYASSKTWQDIQKIFAYIIEPDKSYQGGLLTKLKQHTLADYQTIAPAGVNVQTFNLTHGRLPVTGFKVGNCAYATDCNYMPDESKELLYGIDNLVLDGLRHEPHRTHFTISQAVKLAQELNVKNTYLTHLTHSVDFDAVSKELPSGIELCYDGLEIECVIEVA